MENNKGLTLIALVITIIVLLILAGVSLNLVLGDEGIIAKATTVEVSFNKSEVIEEINILATEKYLEAYNEASAAGDVENMSKYYTPTKVINFLRGVDDSGNAISGAKQYITTLNNYNKSGKAGYYIEISELGRNIDKYAKGNNNYTGENDFFYIEANKDADGNITTAKVIYKNLEGEEEEIGDVVFTPTV